MGEPGLSYAEASQVCIDYSLDWMEIRSLDGTLDIPAYFEAKGYPGAEHRIILLATSMCMLKPSADSLVAFYRFAELAERLQIPYLRVFGNGGGDLGDPLDEAQLNVAAETVVSIRETMRASGWNAQLLLETHDAFSSSERCMALNHLLDEPLKILWDTHHTWKMSNEPIEESWRAMNAVITHIHYKDSVFDASGTHACRYVLPGEGDFPSRELIDLLTTDNYSGGISLEWEKLWHPDLPPLTKALAAFKQVFKAG